MEFSCPDAVEFPLRIGDANEQITIHEGDFTFILNGVNEISAGRLNFDWFPTPSIHLDVPDYTGQNDLNRDEELSIQFQNHAALKGFQVGRQTMGAKTSISFRGPPKCTISRTCSSDTVKRVFFAIPNLPQLSGENSRYPCGGTSCSRLEVKDDHWQIVIDRAHFSADLFDVLERQSGFAVTHVGVISRIDGTEFNSNQSETVMSAWRSFASFAIGRWTAPIIQVACNGSNEIQWSAWTSYRLDPYRYRFCWVGNNQGDLFQPAFAGFLKKWNVEFWRDVLQLAIECYVDAVAQAGSIEGAITICQTALELLASVVLVETEKRISVDAANKLPAADRLRLLLKWAGIPTEIPANLTELTTKGKLFNWVDGPVAITEIRNKIIHPTKRNRERASRYGTNPYIDAWKLGLWYLELLLLRLIDYDGMYANRTSDRGFIHLEYVPWSSKAT